MNAIIMPTGISDGAARTLPRRSASTVTIAPISEDEKISGLVFVPTSRLEICGTISPTNPRSPAKLTTAAADADAHTIPTILIILTDIPSDVA